VNWVEIEYLPVHTPTAAERKDTLLYAENVRQVCVCDCGLCVCMCVFGMNCFVFYIQDMLIPAVGDGQGPQGASSVCVD